MISSRHHVQAAGILTIGILAAWQLFHCSTPQNPWSNPGNVSVTISRVPSADTLRVGDTLKTRVVLSLPSLVDSVVVDFGDGRDTAIRIGRPSGTGPDSLLAIHVYAGDGLFWTVARAYSSGAEKTDSELVVIRPAKPTVTDTTKPAIRLLSPLADSVTVRVPQTTISVVATDNRGVASVRCLRGADTFAVIRSSDSVYSATVTGLSAGTVSQIQFSAVDGAGNTSALTVHVTYLPNPADTDRTPPTLRKLDPATDSTIISANATQIKVIAMDSSGIAGVSLALGTNTFTATRSGDSVWTANITGLQPAVYNAVTVTATDASVKANQTQFAILIKYDPTMTDNTGPTVTPKSGIISDTMIHSAIIASTFEITDASGLDSLFWTANGAFGGMLQPVSGQQDQYRMVDTLVAYHKNTVVVWAVDKSTNRNRRSVSFSIDFNSLPSIATAVSPANAATGIENAGLRLVWSKSTDADGDPVSFVVKYGTDAATLSLAAAVGDTAYTPSPGLLGHTNYFWIVLCISGTDTVRSPSIGAFAFTTKNHPPVISGRTPVDNLSGVSSSAMLGWSVSDPDNDACQAIVYFGTTRAGMTANNVGTNQTFQPAMTSARQYFWSVRLKDSQNADATSDTATYTMYTQNDPPVWNLPTTHDTSYNRISWDLSTMCSDPNGNTIVYSIVNGTGTSITGTTLTFQADSQAITLKAKDAFTAQPCSAVVAFRAFRFRNPQMKAINGGTFSMGQAGLADTVHQVTLSPFWMDSTEVTQGDYLAIMGVNPSLSASVNNPVLPVENVSWFSAVLYCNARSKRDGLDTVYNYNGVCVKCSNRSNPYQDTLEGLSVNYMANGYRMPTEAEWEYACRGNTNTFFYWGNDSSGTVVKQHAWYRANCYDAQLIEQPVATKPPNPLGLYDMAGNVWEWCNDYTDFWSGVLSYPSSTQTNPRGLNYSSGHIIRGGSWMGQSDVLQSGSRNMLLPDVINDQTGFRVVLPRK